MKRCSFCEWIPILPWPVWPLAWQGSLGQNAVVGSMALLLAVRGNIATRSMSGPPFSLQLHRTTVCCRATHCCFISINLIVGALASILDIAIAVGTAPVGHMPCLGAPTAPARGPFQDLVQDLGPLVLA